MALTTAQIQAAYVTFFNRPADVAGLNYWSTYAGSDVDLYNTFAQSAEYTSLFAGQNNTATVNTIYGNLLGRTPDVAGLNYWVSKLDTGALTIGTIANAIKTGALGTDATTVTNKTTAATTFTAALDTTAEITGYASPSASSLAAVKTWLAAVTTDATLATQIASGALTTITTTAATGSAATGSTFTLTTSADNITGTSGDDTIVATGTVETTNGTFSSTTLGAGDQIAGGTGTDTLNFTIDGTLKSAAATAIPVPSISSVETVNVRAVATMVTTSSVTADADNLPGVTAFNSDRSTATVTVTNLASGASAGVIGNSSVTNGAFNADWKAGTAATLNISGGTKGTNAISLSSTAAIASTTVNSTGAANTVGAIALDATNTALTINAATSLKTGNITGFTGTAATITVAGAATNVAATATAAAQGAVSIGTIENTTVKTINASGLTAGGIEAVLNSNVAIAVTGGAGADIITTGTVLTTGTVAAGEGTDTLVIGAATHLNTSALGAKYTGFEVLRMGDSQDVSLVSGITALEMTADTSMVVTGISATQAANITVKGDQATAFTLTLADATGSADSVTLNLKSDTAASNVDVAGLNVIGVETLNINATTGTAGTQSDVTFTSGGANKLKNINVTGSAEVTLAAPAGTAVATTINAASHTGKVTVTGDWTKASSITGSATAVNTFTVGGTADTGSTYIGGAGNDAYSATAAQLVADGTSDVSLQAGAGTDTLTITGGLTLIDNHFTNVTGFEKLASTGTGAVSYTGMGAAFKTAFADGVTITTGTLADGSTYNVGLGLYDKAVNLTLVSDGNGQSTADNITIVTGSGADTVSVTANSWVGTAGAAGQISVSTGAGDDTITVSTGTILAVTGAAPVIVNGGAGKDTISLTSANAATDLTVTVKVTAGESTTAAYDSVSGFDMGGGGLFSSTLDFDTVSLAAYSAAAPSGSTASELTVAVAANGLVTFGGSTASALTLAQKIAAVASVVSTTSGDTALFTHGSNSYVFNNHTSGDSLVELVGITGTSLVTANATTAGAIFIS